MPNMIRIVGQISAPTSNVGAISPLSRAMITKPKMRIMVPMAMPTMAPPWGSPKHSCCWRRRSHLRDSVVPVCRLAPQFVHVVAVSSFLVPHLLQYTMSSRFLL